MRLIEVVVALAIFASVITMSLQGVTSIRGYADVERVQRTLELEGKRGIDRIGAELVNSAWTATTATPTTNLSTFPRIWKMTPLDPARGMAPSPCSPYGDTISFYKLRTEAEIVAGAPTSLRTDNVPFDSFPADLSNKPTPMSEYWKGRPVSSLVLNGGWVDNGSASPPPITSVVWESALPQNANSVAAGAGAANYNANLDLLKHRQYRFMVIPDPQTALGILVKQWRRQNDGSLVDTDWPVPVIGTDAVEIVRDVVNITFGTYLTETDDALARLNPYQVRVDLTLGSTEREMAGRRVITVNAATQNVQDTTGGTAVVRRFTATFTLRSVTDPTL